MFQLLLVVGVRLIGCWHVTYVGRDQRGIGEIESEKLLYFGTAQDRIMIAPYAVIGKSFRASPPRPWSIIRVGRPPGSGRQFDLHPDGERVVAAPAENERSDHLTLVTDFFSGLRRVAPASP